ncbi:hypothetical protein Zmor_020420 [Zophobas morio]|uniref:Gustatory receptor n=1 Tax=Zophobas morio TaxID=2755281 RepID=A0AA38I1A1_9CUCU|nr:hypothetical protein Zmor_020420 [Zophobas morio]
MSHLHYHLVHLVHESNRIFGTTTLWNTAAWFALVINKIYYVAYLSLRLSDQVYAYYVIQFPLLIFQWTWIFFQIFIWTKVQNEANKTAICVHNIWNILVSTNRVNQETRHLQLIVLKLLNTKLDLSVQGFFPLNCNFLYTIVAAVATYVIILVQFKI